MLVSDYDEIHEVDLFEPPKVEWVEGNPYSLEDRPNCLGVTGVAPILQVGSFNLRYDFDPKADTQDVTLTSPEGTKVIPFRTLSGDWFVATFSTDGKYLVIAEPYLIEVYQLQ